MAKMASVLEEEPGNLKELESLSKPALIGAVTRGLSADLAREFARTAQITLEELAALLHLTLRTLQRRLEEGRLGFRESERLWELAHLFSRSIEVLESNEGAVHWFKSPLQVLRLATPLEYARTAVGIRELECILGRIEHGVFS